MAKGWSTVFTNKDTSPKNTVKNEAHFRNTIRNTKSPTIDKLKADSEKAYEKKIEKEESLLYAFDNKLLKSKFAIKQAIRIKKEREAAAKKQNEVPAEVAESAS